MASERSPPLGKQPPGEASGLYLGVLFGAAQAISAIFQYPPDYKIPALLTLMLLCTCILSYFGRGIGSPAFMLSLSGALLAIGICLAAPISEAVHRFSDGLVEKEPPSYYVTVSVFSDDEADTQDPLKTPSGKLSIEVRERDARNGTRGSFVQETDENGIAQLILPRAGQATVRVCHVWEQHVIRDDATSPARTQQIVIGIPPSLLKRCARP